MGAMLVLAIDTATPTVTAGIVELPEVAGGVGDTGPDATPRTRAARTHADARAHAELLTPAILECLADAGIARGDLDAVVVGAGPGPFTGLRVGMATGAAFADALGIPCHPVCSLDAIAADARAALVGASSPPLLVVTDARRREVYFARYDVRGRRVEGPGVVGPDVLAAEIVAGGFAHAPTAVTGPMRHRFASPAPDAASPAPGADAAGPPGLTPIAVDAPSPAGLVACAAEALRAGTAPEPLAPLYLRRPDAVPPKMRPRSAALIDPTGELP